MRCFCRTLATLTVSGGLLLGSLSHGALSINLDFSGFGSGEPTSSLYGGGSPQGVIEAAAAYWEAAYANSTVGLSQTISVTWGSESGSTLATGGTGWFVPSNELTNGQLNFDNDGSSTFFVDPTPFDSSEWSLFQTSTSALGGGSLNTERRHTGAGGVAGSHSDFLSVAIHEIGHALGLLDGYPKWQNAANADSDSTDIDVSSPLPFAGSEIPLTGSHIDIAGTNMAASLLSGDRKLLTAADILLLGEIHGLDNPNLNPIPEPQMAGLIALIGLFVWQRRRRAT